jgi:nicotinamidase-related amidase
MSTTAIAESLLLCIDMQPVFVRTIAQGDAVQRRCAFALAAAQGIDLPIAYIEQLPHKVGGTAPGLVALAPTAPVYAKDTFSALAHPALHAACTSASVSHLLLCGIETPVSIYQTTLDALTAGLQVTLLSDAVGARRPHDAQVCLDALTRAGAHVVPSESVFYALLQSVHHPFFKAYIQLVKTHG